MALMMTLMAQEFSEKMKVGIDILAVLILVFLLIGAVCFALDQIEKTKKIKQEKEENRKKEQEKKKNSILPLLVFLGLAVYIFVKFIMPQHKLYLYNEQGERQEQQTQTFLEEVEPLR